MLKRASPAASLLEKLRCRFVESAGGFHAETKGAAAVEFAMIATVLLLIVLVMCDVVPAWMASNKVQSSAATAADVAGQFGQMQTSDVANVYAAAANVMLPFPATNQSLRITSVFSDGQGNAKVHWSCGKGSLPPNAALSAVTSTPTGVAYTSFLFLYKVFVGIWLDGTNTSYLVTEVSNVYSTPAQFFLRSPLNLTGVSYYLPRVSAYVGFPWDGSLSNTPIVPTTATKVSAVTLSNGVLCSYAS